MQSERSLKRRVVYTSGYQRGGVGGEGQHRGAEWEAQTTECEIGCNDVLYNTRNIADTL